MSGGFACGLLPFVLMGGDPLREPGVGAFERKGYGVASLDLRGLGSNTAGGANTMVFGGNDVAYYGASGQLVVKTVPEPTSLLTLALGALGLGGMALRRRR